MPVTHCAFCKYMYRKDNAYGMEEFYCQFHKDTTKNPNSEGCDKYEDDAEFGNYR